MQFVLTMSFKRPSADAKVSKADSKRRHTLSQQDIANLALLTPPPPPKGPPPRTSTATSVGFESSDVLFSRYTSPGGASVTSGWLDSSVTSSVGPPSGSQRAVSSGTSLTISGGTQVVSAAYGAGSIPVAYPSSSPLSLPPSAVFPPGGRQADRSGTVFPPSGGVSQGLLRSSSMSLTTGGGGLAVPAGATGYPLGLAAAPSMLGSAAGLSSVSAVSAPAPLGVSATQSLYSSDPAWLAQQATVRAGTGRPDSVLFPSAGGVLQSGAALHPPFGGGVSQPTAGYNQASTLGFSQGYQQGFQYYDQYNQPVPWEWHTGLGTAPGFASSQLSPTGFPVQPQAPDLSRAPAQPPSGAVDGSVEILARPQRASTSGEGEDEGEELGDFVYPPPRVVRPSDALEVLAEVLPSAIKAVPHSAPARSEMGKALAPTQASQAPDDLVLLESAMLSATLDDVASRFAGRPGVGVPPPPLEANGEQLLPNALALGSYLGAEVNSFNKGKWKLEFASLPSEQVSVTAEDLAVCGNTRPQHIPLSEKVLKENFEELARRSLQVSSVLDTVLAGLVSTLRDPEVSEEREEFTLRTEQDTEAIQALLLAANLALGDLFSHLGGIYGNSILARREMLLTVSQSALSQLSRRSLRSRPIHADSLFASTGQTAVNAQINRNQVAQAFAALLPSSDQGHSAGGGGRGRGRGRGRGASRGASHNQTGREKVSVTPRPKTPAPGREVKRDEKKQKRGAGSGGNRGRGRPF